jgi:hypothetical protein
VTALRRSESIQDVPISIQAFTGKTLRDLTVTTFDDYIKYLPNLTAASNGPGQDEIFLRGLSAGVQPNQGGGSTSLFPNVAIYLDDQSGQLPNRNLDIYAADLERIEIRAARSLPWRRGMPRKAGVSTATIRLRTSPIRSLCPETQNTRTRRKAYGGNSPLSSIGKCSPRIRGATRRNSGTVLRQCERHRGAPVELGPVRKHQQSRQQLAADPERNQRRKDGMTICAGHSQPIASVPPG